MAEEKCTCAYCREGMSATAEECVDRMVEVSKSLRQWYKKIRYDTVRENNMDEIRLSKKEGK